MSILHPPHLPSILSTPLSTVITTRQGSASIDRLLIKAQVLTWKPCSPTQQRVVGGARITSQARSQTTNHFSHTLLAAPLLQVSAPPLKVSVAPALRVSELLLSRSQLLLSKSQSSSSPSLRVPPLQVSAVSLQVSEFLLSRSQQLLPSKSLQLLPSKSLQLLLPKS